MYEAYADSTFADEYFAAIGNTTWPAGTDAETVAKKTAALTKATMWLEVMGRGKWVGTKTDPAQPLAWPRTVVVIDGYEIPSDTVPDAVKYATCEAAVRMIQGTNLTPDVDTAGKIQEKTIGPITTRYYDSTATDAPYPFIDRLLTGYINGTLSAAASSGGAGSVKMVLG